MDELYSYVEELLTQAAVLVCSIHVESIKSLFVLILLIINVISISYLLGSIFSGNDTIIATPLFWLVLGLFSFGISMLFFWITEVIGKRILRIGRMKSDENYVWNALIPSIGAFLGLVIIDNLINTENEGKVDFALACGLIILLFALAINLCLNAKRTIIVKNEFGDNYKYVYQQVHSKRKIKKYIYSDKHKDISININGKEYKFYKISKKFLKDWFLSKERSHGVYIEKTYIKLYEKIEVVEIASTSHRIVYSSMAGFMILIMLFTPTLLYTVNRLIEYIK